MERYNEPTMAHSPSKENELFVLVKVLKEAFHDEVL